jgi:translation initiation factor IF-3
LRRNTFRKPFVKEELHKINEKIRVPKVRLVGENVEIGVYDTAVALKKAEELELDLVEISPNADPPVCKIIDYKKFLYEKKKREKEVKANAQKTVIKEIRFGPNTDEHDFEFKLKHAESFLKEGAKVKAYVQFKGRAIVFKDRGELLLLKLAKRLEDLGAVEQLPKLEGKRMLMFIAPKKKK